MKSSRTIVVPNVFVQLSVAIVIKIKIIKLLL